MNKDFPDTYILVRREVYEAIALEIKQITKRVIQQEFFTTPPSQFATQYSAEKFNPGIAFFEQRKTRNTLLFLMRYFRWTVEETQRETVIKVDFRESQNEHVTDLIRQVQEGETITVSDKMRGAFGVTDFPLKGTTTEIEIPERDIDSAVFRSSETKIFPMIIEEFKRREMRFVFNG